MRTALRDPDFHTRRLHQKALFYRLPARPLLKWLYMVVNTAKLLDGWAGMTYATLQAIYEYLIVLKVSEFKKKLTQYVTCLFSTYHEQISPLRPTHRTCSRRRYLLVLLAYSAQGQSRQA